MEGYILAIDQSTQSTKALLFDGQGRIVLRVDRAHRQMIDERGYISHDPEEIYRNLISLVKRILAESGVAPEKIQAVGISNQRETALAWNRETGEPLCPAVVWQCARGQAVCDGLAGQADFIRRRTGLRLSPYFSAAKFAWMLRNTPGAQDAARAGRVCFGTMDSFLIYRLTGGHDFRTDYSNASRTQLLNLETLDWDAEVLKLFDLPAGCMPVLTDSNAVFGYTDFEGVLPRPVPIRAVMGDSHAALFAQNCRSRGMLKVGYGTGSSIMMNIGGAPVLSDLGVVTSLAWRMDGHAQYVLEGNINYSGAIVTWLKDDAGLLQSAAESADLAARANPLDHTYLVPAFSGLGAPHWRSDVSAAFIGMSRTTGRAELVRAGLEAIAYQITDIVLLMQREAGIDQVELRVDGGPSRNKWLMQFQSDMLSSPVLVPEAEELSCMGVAYAAGLSVGAYGEQVFGQNRYTVYHPQMDAETRSRKMRGWQDAVRRVL